MISKKQKQKIAKICRKYGIELMLLFGSQATGKTTRESDFDIAYRSQKPLNLARESRLVVELAPILGTDRLDLVNLESAPPLLCYAIFKDAELLYEKEPLTFASLGAYAFKTYIESKPLYKYGLERLGESTDDLTFEKLASKFL